VAGLGQSGAGTLRVPAVPRGRGFARSARI